ncbi:MAG: M61 family metallopeptidase [Gammaproteobacteria bacterium]|nr:M61 family metallopeptidase [Gammaproteobacteria bacterium]
MPIQYSILPVNPQAHLFAVSCIVQDPDPEGQLFKMPAWIPGSYMIRDFAKNIVQLSARSAGKKVQVKKIDKQTWKCAGCKGPLTLTYEVYAWDMSVRSAHLDVTHGYFNGTSVFLQVVGKEDRACVLDISPPNGEGYDEWRVSTAMPYLDSTQNGFGTYQSNDYDDLIDHPVEMGVFEKATFMVKGTPHDIVITGKHRTDMDRLCKDLKKICNHHARFFGQLPPMKRYVFLVMAVGDGYGGLEHRASCSLLCSRDDLPAKGVSEVTEKYRTFLGLCSHEYFHTWNVKRIKPAAFTPYDLGQEVHTRTLWAFEGITSYYDDLSLIRTGLIEPESYLELLAQMITRVIRGKGRFKQTVTDSSFDTWTKFYKQDENAPNSIVSYYTKGAMIALALDLTIRTGSKGKKSLDDVMLVLWRQLGKKGVGVGEYEIEKIANEISGIDLDQFFEQALNSTDDVDLEALLKKFGVEYHVRPAENDKDKGGLLKGSTKNGEVRRPRPVLGVRTASDPAGIKLAHVFDDGAGQLAGLSAGDIVMAMDNIRLQGKGFANCLSRYQAGECVGLHVFRRDELMTFKVILQEAPKDTCELRLIKTPAKAVLARRNDWLHIK